MFRFLFILFIVVPIIEIMVLMNVGAWLGAWPTIAIVIITAWLGAKNVKQQGVATLNSVQAKMAKGEMPSDEIVAGLLLLVAGVLLVTPGFVTDFFGLSLLIPNVRNMLIKYVQTHLVTNRNAAGFTYQSSVHKQQQEPFSQSPFQSDSLRKKPIEHHRGETLEGEFERKE
ncbi:MAG: FxsA family protein [Colwellia sp.]|nr:FxsA family protein [Colwellia sp.]